MESSTIQERPLDVLILAAGLGTRMRSNLAKVLHLLDGRPLIGHVCRSAAILAPRRVYTVIGHQGEDVKTAVLQEIDDAHAEFPLQKKQLGTGDAVNAARPLLENEESTLLVLSGDVPLIKSETLSALIGQHLSHRGTGAACTILTVELDDPTGYGRVIRDSGGVFDRIVEQKDGSDGELETTEINSGIYCFETRKLYEELTKVQNDNAQGEYYLTDVPKILKENGEAISIFKHEDEREIEGINNRKQLAEMEAELRFRTVEKLMLDHGVSFIDPLNTYVSLNANIGRDTVVYPNVSIEGESIIGKNCVIRAGTRIANSKIGNNAKILDNCLITDAEIGDNCNIGPFAHLRPKARMENNSRIGNFVEMKNTVLGKNSKANHLTYLGDAMIGENSNIGAGTITCNYDGKSKHATEIGNNVKIGSDTMLVAPIKVGDGAVTGAGSVVTKDIPEDTLAVGAPARIVKSVTRDE